MSNVANINTGIVAEWISIIDPAMTKDLQYEEKIAAVLRSQTDLLLNSTMTEIKAKHWILTKKQTEKETIIEFSLIAYKVESHFSEDGEKDFHFKQINRLRKKLNKALQEEDYLKAAQLRDKITGLDDGGPAAA
ncbi:MAG: UvrB/UvrC motif-containing protein [Bacteroidia bacterium]|nr:UvrB/UvrC motif-containing protein [Bacteroidia bacterium]